MKMIQHTLLAILALMLVACTGNGQQTVVQEDSLPEVITSQANLGENPVDVPDPVVTYIKHIVVLKPGETSETRDAIATGLDNSASHVYNTVFKGFAADISQAEINALNADGRIAFVEEDMLLELCSPRLENNPTGDPWGIVEGITDSFATPDLAEGPIQFEGTNAADWGVSRMNAFPSPGLQGAGVTVAIVDTGIDNDHPDLAGAIVAEYDAIDDVEGVGTADDLHGHGTHVAGIVGARDNDIATVGVAPLCSLAGVQVFPDGGGGAPNSVLIRAIDWIAANHDTVVPPIKVMNMSLSGTGTSTATYIAIQACNDLDITCVVAAGNDFRDASQQMPANFDNVITVSAMKRVWTGTEYDYQMAMFSNFGNVVDLIAPGQSILSLRNNGATRYASGTSMACPHVAGAAALYIDENLADGFAAVRAALIADGEAGTWVGDPDGVYEPLAYTNEVVSSWHPSTLASAGDVGVYTSLAVINGNPAVSFFDITNEDLLYVRATDSIGSTWEVPQIVDSTGNVGRNTSLLVVNGNPAISYCNVTNGALMFIRATDADGTSWGAPLTLDTTGFVGENSSLAIVNGNPGISYWDRTNWDLKFVRATDVSGSTWGAPQTIDSSDINLYTSLAVVDGNPGIAYYDLTNGDLKFVRGTDASGTAWAAPLVVDSIGTVGLFPSLAVVNGNPAISYADSTNEDLKYIRATNADGSAWGSSQTLDSTGSVGGWPSIAIIYGNPAISYYDTTNGDQKYIKATDANGSGWNASEVVDSTGVVGGWTSLANVNGLPGVSYLDTTNWDLRFAYFGP